MVRFDNNLARQSVSAYPGWWRSFLHSVPLARQLGADKIMHIESDAYILSPRLADFLNGIESGWHVMWSERDKFPETAIQVICSDQFEVFEQFKSRQSGALNLSTEAVMAPAENQTRPCSGCCAPMAPSSTAVSSQAWGLSAPELPARMKETS